MADPRYLEWKRLAAEGGVVVVSILLAFWIDASWEGFVESRREQDQLAAMRAEFASSVIALDEIIAAVQMHADGIGELIALLKAAGTEPVRVPGELLGCAIGWRTSDVSTSTLDALIASGDLNLLQNEELRRDLAGLPAALLDVTEDEVLAMEFAEGMMSAFLAREGLAEVAYANRPGSGWPDPPEFAMATPSAEFIGLLTARRVHFGFALNGLPLVKSYLENLIDQIDAELERKGR